MATAYQYIGKTETYLQGFRAKPGDVAYLNHRPPVDWVPFVPVHVDEPETPELRRPNTAASKADWFAYAEANGVDTTDQTRASVMEYFGVTRD